MVVELISPRDIERARVLVESAQLSFEGGYDNLLGIFEQDRLVATGAREGNVLKMLAIEPVHQGGAHLGDLVTELIRLGRETGQQTFFIYTRPEAASSFQALNFHLLLTLPKVSLLEYGPGIKNYLKAHAGLVRTGSNGAVVANCNPFTLGHRYLIEEAARQVDTLYVFVVREERSTFPFTLRLLLVQEGVRDLDNVVVLDSSHYAVSQVTFPAYFLKRPEDASQIQMEVDLHLFAKHIAPFFHIRKRFIGTEPYCRTTRTYNETMAGLLPDLGIETVEIPRKEMGEEAISAFRVREAIKREAYEELRNLVPSSTLDFLLSDGAREIRERLQSHTGRH